MIDDLVSDKSALACGEMKRDYGTNGNNETNGNFIDFRLFRYFRLFRNLSSFHHPQNPLSPGIFRSLPVFPTKTS